MTSHQARVSGVAAAGPPKITTPTFTSPAALTVTEGVTPQPFTIRTTGSPKAAIGKLTGTLPPGATLVDNHDGTATITWSAPASSPDDYTIGLLAYNGKAATQTLVITVAAVVTPYNVPASIDGTGATDTTRAWQTFLNSRPPGTTVNCPPGSQYRVDGTILVRNRTKLTIVGNGSRWFAATVSGINADVTPPVANVPCELDGLNRGQFEFQTCTDIVLRDMEIEGALAVAGITDGMDLTTPNVHDGKQGVNVRTQTDVQMIRGTGGQPDRLHITTPGATWQARGWVPNQWNQHAVRISGFANAANNGELLSRKTNAIVGADWFLDSSGAVVNEAAGPTVSIARGNVTGTDWSLVRGTVGAAFPNDHDRIHRTAGSWVSDGWQPNMELRVLGFAQDLGVPYVAAVTASDLYIAKTSGAKRISNEAASAGTKSVVGMEDLGAYMVRYETQHCVRWLGCYRVEVDNLWCHGPLGDGMAFIPSNVAGLASLGFSDPKPRCEDIYVHDSLFENMGRQGIAPTAVRRIVIRNCRFRHGRRTFIDFEPLPGAQYGWKDAWVVYNEFDGNQLSSINLKTAGSETQGMVIGWNEWIAGTTPKINVGGDPKYPHTTADVWIVSNLSHTADKNMILVVSANRFTLRDNAMPSQSGFPLADFRYSHNLNIGGTNNAAPGTVYDLNVGVINPNDGSDETSTVGTPPSSTPPAILFPPTPVLA